MRIFGLGLYRSAGRAAACCAVRKLARMYTCSFFFGDFQ
jgi:hypothetical protein